MNKEVKVFGVNEKKAPGLNFKIPSEFGHLNEINGRIYVIFPDKTAVPEEWLDYMILNLKDSPSKSFSQKANENKFVKGLISLFMSYKFDIKSYLKAVLMILVLCLPFFYFGKMPWYECFQPAMAIFIFLNFLHKNDK